MWLEAALAEASMRRRTYANVGHHLGKHFEDFFNEDESPEMEILDVEEEDVAHPTRTLRRLFTSEGHPDGALVDAIPPRRRRAVLEGMRCEAGGDDCRDCTRRYNR
jgi:hypothetical protein